MNSNKTTWSGLIAGAGLLLQQTPGIPHWLAVVAGIAAGFGAMATGVSARDNDKSSEDVGLKK